MVKDYAYRLLSFAMAFVMCMTVFLNTDIAASARNNKVADVGTMNDYTELFKVGNTENSGLVWTDKTVLASADAFSGTQLDEEIGGGDAKIGIGDDSFLVALSAMTATSSVSGTANVPTDTMIILDMSSSMYNGDSYTTTTVSSMIDSVNKTIKSLQDVNPNNRVGVSIYYGGGNIKNSSSTKEKSMVLLPISRYSHSNNKFLAITTKSSKLTGIKVNSNVKNASNSTVTGSYSVRRIAGTYAQLGMLDAMEQFKKMDTKVPATAEYQPNVARTPIFIFMSDGEPTAATTDFTKKTTSQMGNNRVADRNPNQTDFVTQLTAAYVKAQVDAHYADTTPLFYTLSLGTSISKYVMDPSNHTNTTIDGYWNTLVKSGKVSFSVTTFPENELSKPKSETLTVNKASGFPDNVNLKKYVDRAFTANNASELANIFNSIVDDIKLKSEYYSTLVLGDADNDGYVSFVDRIGDYMSVKDVKGIIINDKLYSGACLAANFVSGGGKLGTFDNPTALGDNMVWAVGERLGITDMDTVRTLIGEAYTHGQLAYTNKSDFSNYIGWYADENGKFKGFWYDGIETAPPQGSKFIVKSYGYLGVEGDSDMMYATVQVRRNISTGEEIVTFAVPASLLPSMKYDVHLDKDGKVQSITTKEAKPIRLLYEVGLDDGITAANAYDKVSADYISSNSSNGYVNFYSNDFERDNGTGYDKVNTYSYFRPSIQNEKYYFRADTTVYSNANGTKYNSTTKPTSGYRAVTVYKNNKAVVEYVPLTSTALTAAKKAGDNTWYIPAGTPHHDIKAKAKAANATGTLPNVYLPFVDTQNTYIVGETLGNNGKLSLKPETSLTVSKTIENYTQEDATRVFEFEIKGNSDVKGLYSGVNFTGGVATVSLKHGESVTITGIPAGEYTVTEKFNSDYAVTGAEYTPLVSGTNDTVKVEPGKEASAAFTNAVRGVGNVTITKYIRHSGGSEHEVPAAEKDKKFDISVNLKFNGENLAEGKEIAAKKHSGSSITDTEYTVDENGNISIALAHNEQVELLDLEEGTVLTVTETTTTGTGTKYLAPKYVVNEGTETEGSAVLELSRTIEESIEVWNTYKPDEVKANIKLVVNKTITNADNAIEFDKLESEYKTFKFKLQQYTAGGSWSDVENANNEPVEIKVTVGAFDKSDPDSVEINLSNYITYTEPGIYAYQLFEVNPNHNDNAHMHYDTTYYTFHVTVIDENGQLKVSNVEFDHTHVDGITSIKDENGNITLWTVDTKFENKYTHVLPDEATIDIKKVLKDDFGNEIDKLNGYKFKLYSDESLTVEAGTDNDPSKDFYTVHYADTDIAGEGWIDIVFNPMPKYRLDPSVTMFALRPPVEVTPTPTVEPTATPTVEPTATPTAEPTATPTAEPAATPTAEPTATPTVEPVATPTDEPVVTPTDEPVATPTDEPAATPTDEPTATPTDEPVATPTAEPAATPTVEPAATPTDEPAATLTVEPTATPEVPQTEPINSDFMESVTLSTLRFNGAPLKLTPMENTGDDFDYTEEFEFWLKEDPTGGPAYVTYDKKVVKVTVTVGYAFTAEGADYKPTVTRIVLAPDNDTTSTEFRDGNPANVQFNNTYRIAPAILNLNVTKQLTGRNKAIQANEFSFELFDVVAEKTVATGTNLGLASGETAAKVVWDTDYNNQILLDKAGTYHYRLTEKSTDGEGVSVDKTVYNIHITVTENADACSTNTCAYHNLGTHKHLERTFSVAEIAGNNITFVNSYKPEPVKADIVVRKKLTGKYLLNNEFEFILTETGSNYAIQDNAKTWTAYNEPDDTEDNNAPVIFRNLEFKEAGTYYFVVNEKIPDDAVNNKLHGTEYDNSIEKIKVEVEDNDKGNLVAKVYVDGTDTPITESNESNQPVFENVYIPIPTEVTIGGDKSYIDNIEGKIITDGQFSFELWHTDSNWNPVELYETVRNDAHGNFKFENFVKTATGYGKQFTEAGSHYYLIKETNGGTVVGNILYDSTVYLVRIDIIDDMRGNLSHEINVFYKDSGDHADAIEFSNAYVVKTEGEFVISGTKTLKGRTLKDGEFTFELYDVNAQKVVATTTNDANGNYKFTINLDAEELKNIPDEQKYIVSEVAGNNRHIRYDDTEYHITVEFEYEGNGIASAAVSVMKDGRHPVDADKADFVNRYERDDDPPAPENTVPETGDETNTPLYAGILIAAAIALVVVIIIRKKKN